MYNFCPKCGKKNEGWQFCPDCGFDLTENAPQNFAASENLDFAKLLEASEAAVKEKREEEQRQRTLKLMQQFEYDEHIDGTFTITKLKDKTALNITVPEGVAAIIEGAFKDFNKIINVNLPDSLMVIEQEAFAGCANLKSVNFENNSKLVSVGERAFFNCTSLTSITIGNGVTSIGKEAFYGCNNLKKVYITDLTAWCNIDFGDYSANPLIYAHNLYLEGQLVTNLDIPQVITEIKSHAFAGFGGASITISDSVSSIGEGAFSYCGCLTSVAIPDSVTSIYDGAFNRIRDTEKNQKNLLKQSLSRA